MKHRICGLFNVAPSYRSAIYQLMDQELDCDFYIGDRVATPLKLMDYSSLKGLKKILPYKHLFGMFYWQRGALSIITKPYTDIILSGEYYCLSTFLILILAKITGKRTYAWTHGVYGDETGLRKLAKKIFLSLPYKLLLYGDYARDLLIKDGYPVSKLACIYNSLDYDCHLQVRSQLKPSSIYVEHFGNLNPVLIFLGRIQKVKKLDMLLKAISILRSQGKIFNLVIVGKEVEDTGINQLVKELQLEDQIWFYGSCYDELTNGLLFYNADICVSPGNIGLTSIHALTYGCPIITHDNFAKQMPEFEAIQNGVTGRFFRENNVEDLADKISSFYDSIKDEKEEIRNLCYQIIDQKYNPHYQIEVIKKLVYEENCAN